MSLSRILVSLTITFALIGVAVVLINDPMQLVRTIIIAAVFVAVFYFIYRFFFRRKTAKVDSKYQRAAKQSRKLQQQKQKSRHKSSHLKVIRTGRKKQLGNKKYHNKQQKQHNLTVIDGKKNKKKNRALF